MQLDWSYSGANGVGSLYYPKYPGEPVSREDVQFCITDLASFVGLDASEPRWVYKGAVSDATP